MTDWMDEVMQSIEGISTIEKLAIGLGLSILAALCVRILVWKPSQWLVGKTESEWDDQLMDLAAPLVNYATFLLGIYTTVIWAVNDSIIASVMATLVVLILMLLIGKFLSKSASMILPPTLEKLDAKADLGLSGGTTIILGLTKAFIWGSAILLILAHLNVDITAALASLTIFSLVIGMAMQESASNFIISAQLMIDKPYDIGDKIQIDTLVGTVAEIGFLSTKIRTGSEHLVIIPNKTIASSIVTNFAKGGPDDAPRRVNLRLDISAGYDESPAHVKTILRNIIDENELVLKDPDPVILLTQMLDSAIIFRINCWVEDYGDEWLAKDQLQTAVLHRFREENIEIPFPHMQLKYEAMQQEDAAEAKKKKELEKKAMAEKKKRQEEAEQEDAEYEARLAEERAFMKEKIDELRKQLDAEELEEEERIEITNELMDLETRISGSDDD